MNISKREHTLAVALAEILGNVTPVTPDPAAVLSSVRKIAIAVLHDQGLIVEDGRSIALLPPGYKAVPIDPTCAQLLAVLGGNAQEAEKVLLAADYTVMVNAAPSIPTFEGLEKS